MIFDSLHFNSQGLYFIAQDEGYVSEFPLFFKIIDISAWLWILKMQFQIHYFMTLHNFSSSVILPNIPCQNNLYNQTVYMTKLFVKTKLYRRPNCLCSNSLVVLISRYFSLVTYIY